MISKRPGGAAAAGGFDFQSRVGAWIATRVLAGSGSDNSWGLTAATTLESLRFETEQPIDDILVRTSDDGFAFLQVKTQLTLSDKPKSDLRIVIDAFVRQFLAPQHCGRVE